CQRPRSLRAELAPWGVHADAKSPLRPARCARHLPRKRGRKPLPLSIELGIEVWAQLSGFLPPVRGSGPPKHEVQGERRGECIKRRTGPAMKIARVELAPCVLRKEDPKWRFALGASPTTEGVIVTLIGDDGARGYGYGSATPHMGATQASLTAALDRFAPLLEGRDSFQVEEIAQLLDATLAGNNQAKAAIDCALHELNARALNIPLCHLFGGKLRDYVPILRIIAIKSPAEMAAQAEKLIAKGYRYLKIKLHGEVDEDVERVRAVRAKVGDQIGLTVDANQSYSVKDAITALNRMADLDIDLAEQPIAKADVQGLKQVTDNVPIPVEADEAAGSVAQVFELVKEQACDSISLKIPKLGGLTNTLAAARIC